jgi:hypothetical protein
MSQLVEVASVPLPISGSRPGTEKLCWSPDGLTLVYTDSGGSLAQTHFSPNLGGSTPQIASQGILVGNTAGGPGGNGPMMGPTWTFGMSGGTVYYVNDYNVGRYDPWMWNNAGWHDLSIGYEEALLERDPAGRDFLLETRQPSGTALGGPDQSQIFKADITATSGTSPTLKQLTGGSAQGVNTHPVWTRNN